MGDEVTFEASAADEAELAEVEENPPEFEGGADLSGGE